MVVKEMVETCTLEVKIKETKFHHGLTCGVATCRHYA